MSKTCASLKSSMLLQKLHAWHRAQVRQVRTRLNQNLAHCQTRMATHDIDTLRATWAKQLIERMPVMTADAAALARKLDNLEAQMIHHIAAAAAMVIEAKNAAVEAVNAVDNATENSVDNAVESAIGPVEPVIEPPVEPKFESAEPAAVATVSAVPAPIAKQSKPKRVRAPRKRSVATQSVN